MIYLPLLLFLFSLFPLLVPASSSLSPPPPLSPLLPSFTLHHSPLSSSTFAPSCTPILPFIILFPAFLTQPPLFPFPLLCPLPLHPTHQMARSGTVLVVVALVVVMAAALCQARYLPTRADDSRLEEIKDLLREVRILCLYPML